MNRKKSGVVISYVMSVVIGLAWIVCPASPRAWAQTQDAGQAVIAKRIGTIKAINGNAVTLAVSGSPDVAVTVLPEARLLRLSPGEKDLKNATPVQLTDLHVGDTIRARGHGSSDGNSISALEIVVITSSALGAVRDQIREDWQKRGIGGVVSSVDATAGTVNLTIPSLTDKKTLVIHVSASTVIRRYAPDSASAESAKPITLADIRGNDQLRARGDRSADGNAFSAVEILTGSFPYVEGPIKSVDASAKTVTVQDVLSKKAVQLQISSESQLHQVPPEMAQRMAMMLRAVKSGAAGGGAPNGAAYGSGGPPGGTSASGGPPSGAAASGAPPSGGPPSGGPGGAAAGASWGTGGGQRQGGAGGFQRMLEQTPAVTLDNLHKGDVVAILATEGTASTGGTIIKLFSGVEPILTAAPSASQAMMLTPWSLGGGAPGGEGSQ